MIFKSTKSEFESQSKDTVQATIVLQLFYFFRGRLAVGLLDPLLIKHHAK